ncbi:unnamed protein product [Bemisia tabaci]|uniref:Uncharacterized protein n=2 Tax=Bemisia tabaci TaxID=7038 RepID=A0A9P0EYY9_BEMTA|nr:unnamed protein product [Bemisia tabaci]
MYNMEEMKKVLTYEEFIKFRRKCRLLKAQQQTQPFLEENLGRLEPIVIQNEGTSPLFLEKEPNPFEHLQLHSQAHSQAQAVSELQPTATSGFGAHLLLSDFDESFLADRALDLKSDSMEGFRHSSNYLKTLLESCVGGRALLTYYQR